MQHHTDLIDIVAIGLGLAFVLGFLANKIKLSPLVGYLLAGIIVGPHTPGFVGDADIATQLSEIGVMLLMFGVGLHFSLDDLMEVKWIALPGAIVQIGAATVLGWGLAWMLGWSTIEGAMFGFCLATASTVVLLRAMEERRLLDTQRGRIAVGWLIVEDLACVLALVLLPALAGMLKDTGATGSEYRMLRPSTSNLGCAAYSISSNRSPPRLPCFGSRITCPGRMPLGTRTSKVLPLTPTRTLSPR